MKFFWGINSTTSQEATGSANDRFMGRSIRTLIPNSYNPELKPGELIEKRINNHERRITKKNSNNKVLYKIGDRVCLQNVITKEFKLIGTITNLRLADDGAVVSYGIATDKGYPTTRHRRFLHQLAPEHDPKVAKQNHKERNISKPSLLGKSIEITTDLNVLTHDDSADL